MNDSRWARLQTIFHRASDLPAGKRNDFLRQACGEDEALFHEISDLLATAQDESDPVKQAIGATAQAVVDGQIMGKRFGAYRIVEPLGEGGMGRVFLAQRDDDAYEQLAAVKLLKTGHIDDATKRQIELERQILARLNHPNIAMLLDGGTTQDGTPYVVMQYVSGERLDRYCAGVGSLDDRLILFLKVCSAVVHAHRNLVIHRDIKPSNVLVDESNEPKLLDFGIAKLLDRDSTATVTQAGIMTPAYASPEQVAGQPVTTATDVYSLGALLFEVLTGRPPFELESSSPAEIARAVCNTQPVLPSQATRETGIPSHSLRGDLDNIVLKAMRKEPERRYGSVQELADDINAYLEGHPISARPDSWLYRTRKFVRRNAAVVSVACAALAIVIGLAGFYTVRLSAEVTRAVAAESDAKAEAATAQRVADFMVGLFEASDPRAGARKNISALDLLDEGAARIEQQLADEPRVQSRLQLVMGLAYSHLGLYEKAISLLEDSLALKRADVAEDPLEVAEGLNRLAEVLRQQGNNQRSSELHEEALAIRVALSEGPTWGLGDSHNNFGLLQYSMGRYQYAIELLKKSIEIHQAAPDGRLSSVGIATHNLALVQRQLGRYEEADRTIQRALQLLEQAGQSDASTYSVSLNLAGRIKNELADFESAEALLGEARRIAESVYLESSPRMAALYDRFGTLNCGTGRIEQGISFFDQALSIYASSHGTDSWNYAFVLKNKADCLLASGKAQQTNEDLLTSVAIRKQQFGTNHVLVGIAEVALGHSQLDLGQDQAATQLFNQSITKMEPSLGLTHPHALRARLGLARAKIKHSPAAAIDDLQPLIEVLQERPPSPLLVEIRAYESLAFAQLGDCVAARSALTLASEELRQFAPEHPGTEALRRAAEAC